MRRGKSEIAGVFRFSSGLLMALIVLAWRSHAVMGAEEQTHLMSFLEANRFEYQPGIGRGNFNWDAQAWIGGDYDKLWFKTQGDNFVNDAEIQFLYSRAVSAYWDIQMGARYDSKPEPSRTYGAIGIQGLAPYFIDLDATAFVSDRGELSARFKGTYDLLLSQRLIAEPSFEINVMAQGVPERGIGSGLSYYDLGLRLRYEIIRELAPYIGIVSERKFGKTADIARDKGDETDELTFVAGIRFWF